MSLKVLGKSWPRSVPLLQLKRFRLTTGRLLSPARPRVEIRSAAAGTLNTHGILGIFRNGNRLSATGTGNWNNAGGRNKNSPVPVAGS